MKMCEEMVKLRGYLDANGIEWVDKSDCYCLMIYRTHFSYKNHKISVIYGFDTYGGKCGLLEMMVDEEEPIGYLKCNDVVEIIKTMIK